jgi:sugar phosphate isomerase/epimerase
MDAGVRLHHTTHLDEMRQMRMLTRRVVLERAAAALTAGLVNASRTAAAPRFMARLDRVGVALFTIPKLLDADIEGAFTLLSDIGYKEVELFGPYPFSVPAAHERWKTVATSLGLKNSGLFGRTPGQMRATLDRHGLSAVGMHVDMGTLRARLSEAAEAAHALGLKYFGISAIPAAERTTLDGYKRVADDFNEVGARMARLGVRFIYHNHGYGLTAMGGQIPLRVVLDRTDPKLVFMEMDLFWTVAGGADPVELLEAYPGRYRLMHVKDMKERVRFKGDGGDAPQWMELFPYMADAGSGVLDLRAMLAHAKKSGVEHFLVEQDLVANPTESLRTSHRFLTGLDL